MFEQKWKTEMPQRYDALDKLGYWSFKKDARNKEGDYWQARFEALKAFHYENGHFNVGTTYREISQFGRWVLAQRKNQKKMKTSEPERYANLESIGFWKAFQDKITDTDREKENKKLEAKPTVVEEQNVAQQTSGNVLERTDGPT